MTGPRPDEDEQHVVIQFDAAGRSLEWQDLEPAEPAPPPEQTPFIQRYRYALFAVLALVLLGAAVYAAGAATYDPPSRLPALVFDQQPLYGTNATVHAELDIVRDTFAEPGALELEPAGPAFRIPLPRTVADRLFGKRDEAATIFGATSPAGEFRFLALSDGSGPVAFAIEAPLGLSPRDQPTGVFLALDPADPDLAPLIQTLEESILSAVDGLGVREVSSDGIYIFGPYQAGDTASVHDRIEANAVMAHLAAALVAADSDVSLAAPAFLVLRGPSRGTINALYHPARRLVMEPLWGDSSTASLAHELVHAYLDTVADDRAALLTEAADYFEDAHPVLHGEVVGDLYERLGRQGRAEETLAFLVGSIAAGQTKTVATQRLLESPGNLALSEAVLYSDVLLLIEAGLLPECMRPRPEAAGELMHSYYEAAEAAC